ncbi:MAG: ElyC/SanA/YdcF family protein [Candidatus Omnitrophica bacterium]|nr:ElyC/SanA/YdcF family protein [Candidatus Omnitrophota bacterium]
MIKGKNIICISSIDWDFIWQQHQTIMSTFARNGNRVLFIENTGVRSPRISDMPRLKRRIINWLKSIKGFREESENLYIFSPLIVPFPYSRIARCVNRFFMLNALKRWLRIMEFNNPIIWTFLPTPLVLDIVDKIPHEALIYYCTDNFAATSKGAAKIVKYEKKVLGLSDGVFVMARNMVDYCRSFNKNVTCIPMGVDADVFIKAKSGNILPEKLEGLKGKIIGYIGGIRHSIDQELVEYLAKKFKDYIFMFVGPVQTDITRIEKIDNVIFVGQKKHNELPAYVKNFSVCIIPYRRDDYTDNVSLAKLNEYLIMGKPVVTSFLKETDNFNVENGNILYTAKNHEEFASLIEKAIKEDSDILRAKREEVALKNSWERKIEEMSSIMEDIIKKKEKSAINWQAELIKLYRNIRLKTMRIALVLLFAWIVIFYTPLMWFLAEPLKISEPPRKADAIVVFAGGVGESGQAGQGYLERVEYAAELYRSKFAGNIIFSSGYMYVFKEPLVMKAVAVSLGVPPEAIILEDRARNTYENVEFSEKILKEKGWKEILVVSSPYHMRRVSLVFKKIGKGTKVLCTPIPQSSFYSHKTGNFYAEGNWRQIDFRQIEGILREYSAIVYYWWKGYI